MKKAPKEPDHEPIFSLMQRVRLTPVGGSRYAPAPKSGHVRNVEPQPHWYDVEWDTGVLERVHEGWLEEVNT